MFKNDKKIKDLVTIGILSVITFALFIIGSMATTMVGNFAMYADTALSSLLAGVIFVIICKKVQKPGAILLYGGTFSILYCFMGFWQMSIVFILAAIIDGLIMYRNGYESNTRLTIAYIVFELKVFMEDFFFGL
ncbi:MptD family putative ECF transporter S component [Clostridium cochlearium]|uniref:MptD family putative ECF transporter S component n=1 Tax=Clostridium cochlearium TaxID=1494 RepID=A0A7Y3Y0H8_CLOCO|nr:MptD family putative ECF transporter S component [Clostridium cochlearium]